MMGEDVEAGGHSGLYHTSSQVLLARLYDNVLTNLTNTPGLRQTCVNCGQLEVEVEDTTETETETETSDDNEEDRSDFSDSDLSSTSTDITVRLTRNFSHHNILKVKLELRLRGWLGNVQKHFRNLLEKAELCTTLNLCQACQ